MKGKRNWNGDSSKFSLVRSMLLKDSELQNPKPEGKWIVVNNSGKKPKAMKGFDSFVEADRFFTDKVNKKGGSIGRYKVGNK